MQRDVGLDSRLENDTYQTFPVQHLAYDAQKKTCVADAPLSIGIIISPEYQNFLQKPWFKLSWPRLSAVMDVVMKPIKYLTVIGPIMDAILNVKLTSVGVHLPPNIHFVPPYKTERINEDNLEDVQYELDELCARQEREFQGEWRSFSIVTDNARKKASRKGKEKAEELVVNKHALQVNAFLLQSRPQKLHINVHGLGSSGNSYDLVAPEAALTFQADQWNVTRVPNPNIKNQKMQIRQMIAAAIQAGYTDIRLDGYSYGAGLVRTVYHELMEDKYCRAFLQSKNITLHYTARNGYRSEGMTMLAYVTGFGERHSPNYKKEGVHAPKPNFLMRAGHFFIHHILRIDTLRNRSIRRPIPKRSHNYVVNAVLSMKKAGKKWIMRDGVIGDTNRTSGPKYGHTCIDADFTLQNESHYHGYYTEERYASSKSKPYRRHWAPVMEPHLFRKANQKILADIELKQTLTELAARKKVKRLQQKILLETDWQVRRGTKINYDYGKIKKHVPNGVKQQLDVIKETYAEEQCVRETGEGKTHWRAAFFKLAEISKSASEKKSRYRYTPTQAFYDETKTPVLLNEFTRKQ